MGFRTPNFKKSFKARTIGKYKRAAKHAINPMYGKKGTGFIKNPQKAMYNKAYNRITVDGLTPVKKTSQRSKIKANTITNKKSAQNTALHKSESKKNNNIIIKDGKAKIGNKFYTKKAILRFRSVFIICGWIMILSGFTLLPIGVFFIVLGSILLICANTYKKIAKLIKEQV